MYLIDTWPLTLKWKGHIHKGHWIPDNSRVFSAGQEFPLAPRGNRTTPVNSQFSSVVMRAPAKEDVACWEMSGLGQKRTSWLDRKKCLKAHSSSHSIGRPEQKSPAVVHSYFFPPPFFRDNEISFVFSRSLLIYLVICGKHRFIFLRSSVNYLQYERMPAKGFSIPVCWIGR